MDLESLVESLGHRVLGVARTHKEAVALAVKKKPGLILADIQLADGSSGWRRSMNSCARSRCPVIFITAYPERFLTGERPNPAFLIASRFQPAMVSAIASQALFFFAQCEAAQERTGALTVLKMTRVSRGARTPRCEHAGSRPPCQERSTACLDGPSQFAQRLITDCSAPSPRYAKLLADRFGAATKARGNLTKRSRDSIADARGRIGSRRRRTRRNAVQPRKTLFEAIQQLFQIGHANKP